MKNLTRLFLPLILAGATQVASAAVYNPGDLILVFRDGFNPDVEYDLGSVSNYLNQAAGTPIPVSYNVSTVTANFGGSLSGVSYAVVGATQLGNSLPRAWLTDGSSAPGGYLSSSAFSAVRSVISGAGVNAATALGAGSFPFVDSPSDSASFDYVVSGGSQSGVDSLGGNAPFTVEATGPSTTLPFYEMVPNTESPIPAANLIGSFAMASDGTLSFTPSAVTPTFTTAVHNASAARGGSATLSGNAYYGATYQWYFDGAAIGGATSSTLNLSGLNAATAGTYSLVATSVGGDSATNSATVGVSPAYSPTDLLLVFRDGFNSDVEYDLGSVSNYLNQAVGVAIPVKYDVASVTANFGGSLSGVSYAVVGATQLGNSLSRAWLTDGSSAPGGYLSSSAFSTVRSVISGAGTDAGTQDGGVWPFTDSPSDSASFDYVVSGGSDSGVDSLGGNAPFTVEATGPSTSLPFYEMVPSSESPVPAANQIGNFAMASDGSLSFTPSAVAPTFTASVQNTSAARGGSATLSGSAYDAASYQWYFNGAAISGATGTTLNLSGLNAATAGTYSLVATAVDGAMATNSAAVGVTPAYSPTDLILVFRDGFNPDVEYDLGSVSNYPATGTPISVSYDVDAVNANFGGSLSGVSYAVVGATQLGNSLSRVWLTDGGTAPSGYLSPSAFSTVRSVISGAGTDAGAQDGGVWPFTDSPGDSASFDYVVSGGSESGVDSLGGNAPFTVEATGPSTTLPFYEMVPSSESPVPPALHIGNFALASNGALTFTPDISVNAPPTAGVAAANGSVLFSVTAGSFTTTHYQWQQNGTNLVGQTGSTLTLTGVKSAMNNYHYDVVVSDASGSVTSSPVALSVVAAGVKIGTVANKAVYAGQPVTFTATVTGGNAPTYQWYSPTGAVAGATSLSYSIALANFSDAGGYHLHVSDATFSTVGGSTNGNTATLAVNVPETISNPTAATSIKQGQQFILKTTVANKTALAYANTFQWYANNVLIPGATFASYTNHSDDLAASPIDYTVKVGYSFASISSNLTSAAGVVTVAADSTIPTVAYVTPSMNKAQLTNNTQVINSQYTITGKATDNSHVSSVYMSLNGGAYQAANVTNSPAVASVTWGLAVNPAVGTNTVSAYSVDFAGNNSLTNVRSFFYAVPATVNLTINGDGTVTGTNAVYFVNRAYTLTETAAANNLFSNWVDRSDSTIGVSNKFTFNVESNFDLTANFVTNRFLAQKGTFYGLFSDTNGTSENSAGCFSVTVSPGNSAQAFSAQLFVDGDAISGISGKFDLTGKGTAAKAVLRKGKPALNVSFQMNFDDTIGGTVADSVDNWTSTVAGDLNTYSTVNPSTNAGTYNLLIPGFADPADGPSGYSYLTLKVAAAGTVSASGSLADGQTIGSIQAAAISTNGNIPLYTKAYVYGFDTGSNTISSYRGALLGWVNITGTNVTGTNMVWLKTSWTNGFYNAGFTNSSALIGASNAVLSGAVLPGATLTFAGGNLSSNITDTVLLATTGSHATGITNQLKALTLTASSGAVTGTFTNTATHVLTTFKGLYVGGTNDLVGGWFLGTSQAGSVQIQ